MYNLIRRISKINGSFGRKTKENRGRKEGTAREVENKENDE